jgi:uncharacterized membrane protein YphA (DoxX/SURF4 family)
MKTSSKIWVSAARYAQGGIFLLFGLNGFLQFLPTPPMPEAAGNFAMALAATGYMFPLIKATEVVSGVLLLSGRFVPLALALIAPVIVNIVAFHAFLAPAGLALPAVLLATQLYLAWSYRDAFAPMLRAVVKPHGSREIGDSVANSPARATT